MALVVALFAMAQMSAQTYENLWRQARSFELKDLPKSEIGVMKKIISKATVSKDYGQLLAAKLRSVVAWGRISNDSIAPALERIEHEAERASDPVQKAVMYAALGRMYADNANVFSIGDEYMENMKKADSFLAKALENPSLLAQVKSTTYEPLVLQGMDGTSFNHDLLHVIGFEVNTAEAYQKMATYYKKVGNRGAACLCEYQLTQLDRKADIKLVKKSKYLQTIDSLIHVYKDIPEAGELAVEHYRFMDGATDAKAADKLNYINYALNHWGGWSRMNELRNAQKRLTEPMFLMLKFPKVIRPSQKQWLIFDKVRNLGKLTVNIARLNITADNDYDVEDKNDYKALLSKTTDLHKISKSLNFVGHPAYEIFKDSIEISDLPLGAYLMEIVSDNPLVPAQRDLFYVSDLSFMVQQLPGDKCRYIVVNATNGQPVSGATLTFSDRGNGNKKQKKTKKYVTDANGEVICGKYREDVLVTTDEDKYTPECSVFAWSADGVRAKKDVHSTSVYTDRSIYRPGQTVHSTAICFVKNGDDVRVESDKKVTFSLLDASYKMVAEKSAVSDAYGSASIDFELPAGGLTGNYSLRVNDVYKSFRVEEYKRPTFEVTFPKVNQKYTWGDTVIVKGTAKTYAGVPVQGAKVNYHVTRRSSWWWSRSMNRTICEDTGETDADGAFEVKIPLKPDLKSGMTETEFLKVARFYNFDVSATVVSESGESREGEMSLPLGTKPTAFTVDLPGQVEKDSLKQLTFGYKNSGGMDIAGQVRYRFDGGEWQTAATNTPVLLTEGMFERKSGEHQVEAICEQDTLQQKFVLFSMEDGHPMVFTKHWSYQSAKTFPSDGKPVYLQVGSSENGVYVAYSIAAGGRLLEKGAWELGDSIVTRSFTYQPEYGDGLTLNYSFVKDGVCYSKDLMIGKPLPDKRLNLSWKTFRNRLTPGQKEEWTLQVTTPDGKPAKAQLLSVLYDKSLDQIEQHQWNLTLGLYRYLCNYPWSCNINGFYPLTLSARYPTKYYLANSMDIDHFDESKFLTLGLGSYGGALEECVVVGYGVQKKSSSTGSIRIRGMAAKENRMQAAPMTALSNENVSMNLAQDEAANTDTRTSGKEEKALDNVLVRENLNETAFFYPALETDAKGNVAIKFTLPESVTTWKFMGLAHDKEMRNGTLIDEAVAQKTVMVQPNMPRFLREGDKATIVAKLFNTSDKKVGGNARMQIIDPETNKVVWQKNEKYDVDANGTATLSFYVEGLKEGIYINKVVATGNGYSDGEQHYLPVLSNRELVTNTLPFTLTEKGTKDFDLSSLFAGNVTDAKMTVEYTNNPSWLMIQALPSLSNPTDDDNAISLMAAIYSNSIARHIMQSSPVIKQVVELWKKEIASNGTSASSASGNTASGKPTSSLMSSLEKNQELKNLILNETPWVMDADKESEQKSALVNYFDESMNSQRLSSQLSKLKGLQNNDGSFSWWKGMMGSRCMTTAVVKMMVRLDQMIGNQSDINPLFARALSYLRNETAKEVKEMKKEEAKGEKHLRPSEDAVDYLYILVLDGKKLSTSASSDKEYLLKKMVDKNGEFTIYGKAIAAVVLAKNGYKQQATDYLRSINEYSVYKPEIGRYFDTRKAYYSWRDYRIPTQVAAIETMQLLGDEAKKAFISENISAKQAINEMQLWLLQSKRTQAWDTPVNTVNAVYAFLDGKEEALKKNAENANLKLDGKNLSLPKATVGLGYVKVGKLGAAKTLTVDKKNDGTSWGAVYAQFTQPSAEITSAESGIKISRKVTAAKNVKVGDKVTVVLTITTDRDYDFVQVMDKRAACLEPVYQTSGYQWDMECYVSPKDYTTNFYFDRLSKGKHIVEMEYYVDRKGDYQSGSCAAQCAYSPEFGGRAEAYGLRVTE